MALHEWHVQRPPRHAEYRKPDQFLLDEELEERDAAIENRLQYDDVDPGLVIGEYEIPAVLPEFLRAGGAPFHRTAAGKKPAIDHHPVLAKPHEYLRKAATEARDRHDQLHEGEKEERREPDEGIDGQARKNEHTAQIAQ